MKVKQLSVFLENKPGALSRPIQLLAGAKLNILTLSLADTKEFDQHEFTWQVKAPEWKWARLSLWDIAGNGAFTTPIWRN